MTLNRSLSGGLVVALLVLSVGGSELPAHASGQGLKQSMLAADGLLQGDDYGSSTASSGNTVVVAAYTKEVGNQVDQGAVYVFQRPTTGWTTMQPVAVLTVDGGVANDLFGSSVAIQGKTIVVGASGRDDGHTNQGVVYIFKEPTGGWKTTGQPDAVLSSSDGAANDDFGSSVAIDGATIAVGADEKAPVGDTFEGEAYVFTEPATGWKTMTQTATLTPYLRADDDFFGGTIAVSGTTVVVAASHRLLDSGRAYVFVRPAAGWTNQTQETRELVGSNSPDFFFGTGLAMQGDTVVVGEDQATVGAKTTAGKAFVFTEPVAGWGTRTDPLLAPTATLTSATPTTGAQFGSSVAIDGSILAIGASDETVGTQTRQGAAYLFLKTGSSWSTAAQYSRLVAADGGSGDTFGNAVSISGTSVAVGARSYFNAIGRAYMFAVPGPTLTKLRESHKSWRLGPKGTSFSFALSQAGKVKLALSHQKHRKTKSDGILKVDGKAGKNTVRFAGKVTKHKTLAAGHETATVTMTNANGTTAGKALHFVVKAKKKKK